MQPCVWRRVLARMGMGRSRPFPRERHFLAKKDSCCSKKCLWWSQPRTGAHEGRVEQVGAVGGRDEYDTLVRRESVHLRQQLVQRLLALLVRPLAWRPQHLQHSTCLSLLYWGLSCEVT